MFDSTLSFSMAVAAIFFAAGAVKGMLGMGLPTIAIGLLGLLMPVSGAAALLTVPSLVTNAWQAAAGPHLRAMAWRLWPMQAGIAAGVAAAPWLLPPLPDAYARQLLGACLFIYGTLSLLGRPPPAVATRLERGLGFGAGAMSGAVTALTGVFVLPAVPYLQALRLRKDEMAQALGLCFTTSTLALAASLAMRGHLDAAGSVQSALLVPAALAGMWAGQVLRGAMSEALFRRCFALGLMLLGIWLW